MYGLLFFLGMWAYSFLLILALYNNGYRNLYLYYSVFSFGFLVWGDSFLLNNITYK